MARCDLLWCPPLEANEPGAGRWRCTDTPACPRLIKSVLARPFFYVSITTICSINSNLCELLDIDMNHRRFCVVHRFEGSCKNPLKGRAKRLHHRHPPRAQPVAPLQEPPCRRPRLPPRRCTDQAPSRAPRQPGGAHGRRNAPIASPFHGMRCLLVSPLFASWPWLLHTG